MALCCGFLRSSDEGKLFAIYYNPIEIFAREIIDLTECFDQWPRYLSKDMKLNGNMREWVEANPLNLRGNDYWLTKYSQACRVMWTFWNFNGGFKGYNHYNLIPLGVFAFGGLSAALVLGVQMDRMISFRNSDTLKQYAKMQPHDIFLRNGDSLGFRWKFLETGVGSAQTSFMQKLYTPHHMLSDRCETLLMSAAISNHRVWDSVRKISALQEPETKARPDDGERLGLGWDLIEKEYDTIKAKKAAHVVTRSRKMADASEMAREAREMEAMEREVVDTERAFRSPAFDFGEAIIDSDE